MNHSQSLTPNNERPRRVKETAAVDSTSPARDKLNQIEIMLLETEESLNWLKERLGGVSPEHPL